MAAYVSAFKVSIVRDGNVRLESRPVLRGPADAVPVFRAAFPDDGREHFSVLTLDIRHKVTGYHPVSVGTLNASIVHPREVFRVAILAGAAAIVIGHNHPSGDPEPSAEDMAMTRRIAAAGELIGIPLMDSLVIASGNERWCSLYSRGVL